MLPSTKWLLCIVIILACGCAVTTWMWWRTPSNTFGVRNVEPEALSIPNLLGGNKDEFLAGKSAVVLEGNDGRIIYESNGFERVPMASLTKLMTAMVALDHQVNTSKTMEILPSEYGAGGNLLMHPGETVSVKDLLHASLIGSANNATLAYVRSMGMPMEDFVEEMNRKAVELGLEQTHFVEVTGLDPNNVSTAYEVGRLASAAFRYLEIAQATSAPTYTIIFGGSGRDHTINNTNKLIAELPGEISGSKTGFLYEAGYCLVVKVESEDARVAVVLNSPSEEAQYQDIQKLLRLPVW